MAGARALVYWPSTGSGQRKFHFFFFAEILAAGLMKADLEQNNSRGTI